MYRLSSIILVLFGCAQIFAQSSPHGKELTIDCAKCHTSESWNVDYKTIKFDHSITDFALEGTHLQTNCTECHTSLVFDDAQTDCISCHTDMHSSTVGNDCARCHTPESWIVNNIPELHEQNGFPLTGSHNSLACAECHTSETNLRFDRVGNDCISCHNDDFNNTKDPDHIAGNFSKDCSLCHSSFQSEWTPSTFEHGFFPLTDGHDIKDCTQCHTNNNFDDTSSDCVSCHQTDFDNSINPNHTAAGFDTDCKQCHTPSPDWVPVTWDHDFFPLTLGHDVQDCNACHTTANYTDQIADCVSCHQTDFNNTTDPNHVDAGFPTDCITCHTTNPNWTPATFDHNFFPLTDGHDLPDCKQCHNTANFSDQIADCVSCHQTNYDNTTSPNHTGAGFDTDCVQCHTPSGWTPSTFDHSFFPLTLGHDVQDCATCHTTTVYADQSADCVSCHQTDFNNTTDPNHVDAGFPTDCITCHTTNPDWTPATFDHSFFPLTDGHDLPDCKQCHTTASFSDQVADCVSCHQTDFDNTTNPVHIDAGFSTDCIACHTPSGWTPSTFDHSVFPLTLGHDIQDCTQCHNTGNYSDQTADCVSCHQTNYDNTTNPVHIDAGFSTDCIACHTPGGWTPATFDHNLFPLTLGHDITDCTQCHNTASYSDQTADCVSCHQQTFDNTTNPNHTGAGFNTDCISCHTTNPGWTPVTFDHTFFPLTLGHDIQDCATCHTTPVYADQSADCVSCHLTDFNNTTDPNHVAAGFPTDCISCHTTNPGWTPSTFDHDGQYFPIYSGKHQGEWSSCSECHTTSNNFVAFSCIDCHEHNNQADLANDHNGVADYVYQSTACFECHPNGDKD